LGVSSDGIPQSLAKKNRNHSKTDKSSNPSGGHQENRSSPGAGADQEYARLNKDDISKRKRHADN
jgi:hypothetical protein